MTDTPSTQSTEICSLFTIKLALENLRTHALRVRDTAQGSAIQLAGPSIGREFVRKDEIAPAQGINSHLLSLVDDIEAILRDCDDFAESILVLTGKWHQEEEGSKLSGTGLATTAISTITAAAVSSALDSSRQEPTPADEPGIALNTGIADLVSTIAGTRAEPKA